MSMNLPEMMTRKEVAAVFGVTPTTVGRWIKDNGMPYVRTPGGGLRYLRSDVLDLLASHRQTHQDVDEDVAS